VTRSQVLRFSLSIGAAVVLLVLFLRHLDFKAVGLAIRNAHAGWLLTAAAAGLAATPFIRSWRWIRLLKSLGKVRPWDANSATAIGFAASVLLPARAGEIVRPVALSRSAGLPLGGAIASVGLERLIDLLAVISLFVTYAFGWAPAAMRGDEASRFELLRRSAVLLGAGALSGVAVLVALSARPALADRALGPLLKRLPEGLSRRISSVVGSVLAGLGALKTVRDGLFIVLSTLLLWLTICFQVHATLRAFDLTFPFPVSFFILAWAVMGLAVPTPGGVGGYHAAVAYALTGFYGVEKDTAAAFALTSHVISFAPITILGLFFLVGGGMSLKSLAATGDGADGGVR
jgi:uncharacterized protein (TIRG00374 family)